MKKIITITGPSGSGKSTTELMLEELMGCYRLRSVTTRAKREDDIPGAYKYITQEEFDLIDSRSGFKERATFGKNSYGLEEEEIQRFLNSDKSVAVFVVEINGLIEFKSKSLEQSDYSIYSTYLNISKECQIERMIKRGNTQEFINSRITDDNISSEYEKNKNLFDMFLDNGNLKIEDTAMNIYMSMEGVSAC